MVLAIRDSYDENTPNRYPKVIYQDKVGKLEFRVVARIDSQGIKIVCEQSEVLNEMQRPNWKRTTMATLLDIDGSPNFYRVEAVVAAVLKEISKYDLIKDAHIIE